MQALERDHGLIDDVTCILQRVLTVRLPIRSLFELLVYGLHMRCWHPQLGRGLP